MEAPTLQSTDLAAVRAFKRSYKDYLSANAPVFAVLALQVQDAATRAAAEEAVRFAAVGNAAHTNADNLLALRQQATHANVTAKGFHAAAKVAWDALAVGWVNVVDCAAEVIASGGWNGVDVMESLQSSWQMDWEVPSRDVCEDGFVCAIVMGDDGREVCIRCGEVKTDFPLVP